MSERLCRGQAYDAETIANSHRNLYRGRARKPSSISKVKYTQYGSKTI